MNSRQNLVTTGNNGAFDYEYHYRDGSSSIVCSVQESFGSEFDVELDRLLAREFVKIKGNCGLRRLKFGVLISPREYEVRILATDFVGYETKELRVGIESALLQIKLLKRECPYIVEYTYSQNIMCPVERSKKPSIYEYKVDN